MKTTVKQNVTGTLAERVKQLRESAGLTQPALSRVLSLSTSYINLLESGSRTNPTIETVDRICTFFGVARDWLIEGKAPMFTDENPESARERFYASMRDALGAEDDFERREQQVIAEISVLLAQAPYCDQEQWKGYRRRIIAAVDAHAGFCIEHSTHLKISRLRVARSAASGKKQ